MSEIRRFRWSDTDRLHDGNRVRRTMYRLALWLGLGCSPSGHWEGVCTRCRRRERRRARACR